MIGSAHRIGNTRAAGDDYRRQARRLRRAYADRPDVLHRQLRQLSDRTDRVAARERANAAPLPATVRPEVATGFAYLVSARMDGPVLRYTQRASLLREAARRGIGRFEANLIIAVTEHRARGGAVTVEEGKGSHGGWRGGLVGVALGTQLVIAGLVWWVVWG